jgi:hypothetical protein
MRVLGICLLGLGIVLLLPSGLAIASSQNWGQVIGFVTCAALIPVPMIVGGIVLIRRADDAQAADADVSYREPEEESAEEGGGVLTRVRAFDLNRLNWVGWLLLLATFAFVLGEAAILVVVIGKDWGDRVTSRLVALGLLFLAVGFFVGVRCLLGFFGVSIFRR